MSPNVFADDLEPSIDLEDAGSVNAAGAREVALLFAQLFRQ